MRCGARGRAWSVAIAIAAVGFAGAGCATSESEAPGPSAADVSNAERVVAAARQSSTGDDGAIRQHLQMAERELGEAKQRLARKQNRGAALSLARAEADGELSRTLQGRERAIADAEALEKQLDETKRTATPPAAAAMTAPPPPASAATGSTAVPASRAPATSPPSAGPAQGVQP
jgi:hypothetical protein